MKVVARHFIQHFVAIDAAWKFLGQPLAALGNSFTFWRDRHVVHQLAERLFAEPIVQSGIFAGLRYPGILGCGGAVYPRLLGTYENELHPAFTRLLARRPALVVDVGCAEGFYAVGVARILSETRVVAFDIDPEARERCTALARVNNVAARVQVECECTKTGLIELCRAENALIICDCEGFEADLFDASVAQTLSHCDFVIELHDFVRPGITPLLQNVFSGTHDVEMISAIPTADKVMKHSGGPSWNALTHHERTALVHEHRPAPMQWLVASAKSKEGLGRCAS